MRRREGSSGDLSKLLPVSVHERQQLAKGADVAQLDSRRAIRSTFSDGEDGSTSWLDRIFAVLILCLELRDQRCHGLALEQLLPSIRVHGEVADRSSSGKLSIDILVSQAFYKLRYRVHLQQHRSTLNVERCVRKSLTCHPAHDFIFMLDHPKHVAEKVFFFPHLLPDVSCPSSERSLELLLRNTLFCTTLTVFKDGSSQS
mmetsp:Transcript_12628/g.44159  ORF Transcript_12628/g.44159 Transcript_12628/m.44159 type:complete len:201 (+) Transcript_12628:1016-1618(+)